MATTRLLGLVVPTAGSSIVVETRRYAVSDRPSTTTSTVWILYVPAGCNSSTSASENERENVTDVRVVRPAMIELIRLECAVKPSGQQEGGGRLGMYSCGQARRGRLS